MIESFLEMSGLKFSTDSGRYPNSPYLADGVPMFEGLEFDKDLQPVNPRPTLSLCRSRKRNIKKLSNDIADTIRAGIALMPPNHSYYTAVGMKNVRHIIISNFLETCKGEQFALNGSANWRRILSDITIDNMIIRADP